MISSQKYRTKGHEQVSSVIRIKSTKDWPKIAKKREYSITATPIVFIRFPIFSLKKNPCQTALG